MTRRKILISICVLASFVVIGGAWLFSQRDNSAIPASAAALPQDAIHADDKVMGDPHASVTIIEYFAQACSACANFDMNVFPLLKAKYIDTGKVRYAMRLFPLFPIDGPAYKLDLCVPPERFFQTADLLFRNQPQWDSAEYPGVDAPGGLSHMAHVLGLPDAKAQSCMNSTAHDAAINKVAEDGLARYAISSTPTFVIDFHKADFQVPDWHSVQEAIDAALAAKGAR